MLSIVNSGIIRGCQDQYKVWDKAVLATKYLPWADLAIGIILCTIGVLAGHGIIPMAGANWMIAAGSIQIILTVFFKCFPCCNMCRLFLKESIQNRSDAGGLGAAMRQTLGNVDFNEIRSISPGHGHDAPNVRD